METVRPRVCLLHNYRESQQVSMMLYAERLGEALERRGWGVDRVRPPDFLPRSCRRWRPLEKLDLWGGRFVTYPRLLRGRQADVFHIVDHGQAFLVGAVDPRRTVVTCHDLILLVLAAGRLGPRRGPPVATRLLRHSVERLRRAAAVVAVSERTRLDLAEFAQMDPGGIPVIYPGLNDRFEPVPAERERARRSLGLGSEPVVLHVGVSDFYKNLEACIETLAILHGQGIPAVFVRAGQRLRSTHLALARRLRVADSLRDLGPLPPEDLRRVYSAADVLLFPSLYEGFGWPPLEAMASGLPVVCSRSGSLPEVVAGAALTAESEDVEGLARHVAAVLQDSRLAESLRSRGLARAAQFSWDRAAERYGRVYEGLVA